MPISAIGAVGGQDAAMLAQQGSRIAAPKMNAGVDSASHAGAASAPTEVLSERLKAMKDQEFGGTTITGDDGAMSVGGNTGPGDMPAIGEFEAIPNAASNGGEIGGPSYLMEKVLQMVEKDGANALLAQANQLPSGAVSHTTH